MSCDWDKSVNQELNSSKYQAALDYEPEENKEDWRTAIILLPEYSDYRDEFIEMR